MALSLNPDDYAPHAKKAEAKPVPEPTTTAEVTSEVERSLAVSDETKAKVERALDPQVAAIMSVDATDLAGRRQVAGTIRSLGAEATKQSEASNALLDQRLKDLGAGSSNTDAVGNQLAELARQVEELNPAGIDFYKRGVLGKLASRTRSYLRRYETARATIDGIVKSLRRGAAQLDADSVTLERESVRLQQLSRSIAQDSTTARELSAALADEVERRKSASPDADELARLRWVENDVLFPLTRKAQNLEVLLATNQQSIIAMEVAKRNNDVLAETVRDATTTSVQLLRTGVTLQAALQNQRRVAEQVRTLEGANTELLRSNAELLRDNGQEIQELSTRPVVDADALTEAYETCLKAIDDADTFRERAIPEMQEATARFHELYERSKQVTDRLTADEG